MWPLKQAELPLGGAVGSEVGTGSRLRGGELRRIVLGDRIVHYMLRRGRRRTIGLTIDQRGLRVGAPPRAAMADIESLLRKHAAWVVDKLDSWHSRPAAQELVVADGISFAVLGETVSVRVISGGNTFRWPVTDSGSPDPSEPPELVLAVRADASASALLERALRERARQLFTVRMADFCAKFSIMPPPLSLTSARTRWGSCSRLSGIRLNWRLIHAPLPLIDYVLAHELAHLKEMNHTARFWAEVGRLYPDWPQARRALRSFGETLPRFAK